MVVPERSSEATAAPAPSRRPGRPSVHLVTAVWGEEYARLFLRVLVPSLLTPRNLPALLAAMDARWRVLTLEGERGRFEGTPELARLREVVPVDVVEVGLARPASAHQENINAMAALHARAIREAEEAGAAMVFLSPDCLLSEGSLATVADLARQGKRAVMVAGLRLVREDFLAEYLPLVEAAGPSGLAPRALVRLALRHLHPWSRALIWGGPDLANTPAALLWRAGEDALLGRFFHLHPLFVDPEHRVARVGGSVDDGYVSRACPDLSTIAVVRDSDDLVVFELTSREDVGRWWQLEARSVLRVAEWTERNAHAHHHAFFRETLVFRSGPVPPLAWQRARASAARVALLVRLAAALRLPAIVRTAPRVAASARDALRAAVTRAVVRAKATVGIERPLLGRSAAKDQGPQP